MFQTTRGMKDSPPEEMLKQQFVIDVIRRIYQKYGFDPLDTPALEDWGLLSAKKGGGEEIKQEIYYFKDKSDREVGLRFDLTVPLARFFVNNPKLPLPFKRSHIAKVWRYDRPGAMRWREFWQADADTVGSDNPLSDAEFLRAACEIFYELGLNDVVFRINNRKTLQAFVESIGVKDYVDVFRTIDKLDKMGKDGVEKELKEKGVNQDKIKKILEFIEIKNLKNVRQYVTEGVDEIEKILDLMGEYKNNFQVDMSLVRGLEYYTGPICEMSLGEKYGDAFGVGSSLPTVACFGRFDTLTEAVGGKKIPATGGSIGVDRVIFIMEKRGLFKDFPKTVTKIFVISVNENMKNDVISIVNKFRKLGISSEFDLMGRSLSKQLDYASSRGIPYVIVIGEKELKSKKAKLRDMKTGEEKDILLNKLDDVKKNMK
ncbi:MAG: histidine--tRNA ligase [Candidatus Aenigmarchaeota archaeon]|nr:histidine--tRNA ligase [Candidatus Aenigmarchaeota archaeon]